MKVLPWVFLLLLVPLANGQTTEDLIWQDGEEGELLTWIIYSDNFQNAAASTFNDNGTWLKFHSMDKAVNQSVLNVDVWVTITIQSDSDGAWNYSFEASIGDDFTGCDSEVATRDPGTLGGSPVTYYSFPIRCNVLVTNATEDQEFTWWINRSVEGGNPDTPIAQHFSVRLDRSDFVVYPMDINITNLETWIPIVFWLVLLGLAFWFGWTWTAAFSIPGLMFALFPDQVPGGFEQYLLLAVLGLALEYFTGRRQKDSEELEV